LATGAVFSKCLNGVSRSSRSGGAHATPSPAYTHGRRGAAQHRLAEPSAGELDAASAEKPHGKQIAGTPARSMGIVNSALRGAAADHAL
jgi:hypothetical protein